MTEDRKNHRIRAIEENGITRRQFLARGATFAFAAAVTGPGLTVLSGCGGEEGEGGSSVTLRWSMWSATPAERKVWEDLAKKVTEVHPNIKVKLETVSFEDYWDKLQTQLASGNEADIISMQALRMPGFAARNAMQPLGSFIEDDQDFDFSDYFTVIEEALSFNNEVYALAYDLGPPIFYYNVDLFETAGVPTPSPTEPMSWEEFRETARALTNKQANQYGYIQDPTFDWMVPWLWSGGGGYMNSDMTKSTLDSPDSIDALEFLASMFKEEDQVAAPITDLANSNFGNEAFYSGKIGMNMDGPWQVVNVRENVDFNFDFAPFPAGSAGSVGMVNGSGFGISNNTDKAEEAWKALKVITSSESLKMLANAGRGYPARRSAVPAFEDPNKPPKNDGIVKKILDGEIGEVRPYQTTATWQETIVMLQQELVPILLGRKSVQEAVADAVPKFNRLLDKHQSIVESGS